MGVYPVPDGPSGVYWRGMVLHGSREGQPGPVAGDRRSCDPGSGRPGRYWADRPPSMFMVWPVM